MDEKGIVISSHGHENIGQVGVCKQMLRSLFILNDILFDQSLANPLNSDLAQFL